MSIIATSRLTRTLGEEIPVTLVSDISVSIDRGEFVSIIGPSGSGKSSLLYLLGLLDQPTSGTISLHGRETNKLSQNELCRLRLENIGFVFQFHFLLPEFTVLENVTLPMERLGRLSKDERMEHAMAILTELGLKDYAARKPSQLSGGQRQRAAIARALANKPILLLADEPTGNLDSKNSAIVFDIFRRLVSEHHQTVVTVTHDAALAAKTDRSIEVVDGKVVAAQPG